MFTKLFFTPVYSPSGTRLQGWVVTHYSLLSEQVKHWSFKPDEITKQDVALYHKGALVQQAFARLSRTQREFLISGLTPREQASLGMPVD